MIVVITGADGFIGRNLRQHLAERRGVEVRLFGRGHRLADLGRILSGADFVFHLAGVNRPQNETEFERGNVTLTKALCGLLGDRSTRNGSAVVMVYASSIQAERDNPYGRSKHAAEQVLVKAAEAQDLTIRIFRLPNVFGKWARPNYNSAVATFCHNIARDLPVRVDDGDAPLTLMYVDDVVRRFLELMDQGAGEEVFTDVEPRYETTVGEVATLIANFHRDRQSLTTERVGEGLVRALYSTYVSYLPPEQFAYEVPQYADTRGVFVEMLKTRDSGQFSFFTAHPGVTRGGHYHHSKIEKFLVVVGEARFRFRHVQSGETHEVYTAATRPHIVETVPGWTHDITNVGDSDLVVMLWASEIFDRARPDTYACAL